MTADAILAELLTESARADPYPQYRALRKLGPIAPLTQGVAGATPFAAVATGYDLVDEVLRDPAFYKKSIPGWQQHTLLSTFETSMMFSNPPDHARMRNLFSKAFTPRRLAAIEPVVEEVVQRLLDQLEQHGAGGATVDFVEEFAVPLPASVVAAFVGIPAGELDWYRARVAPIDAFLDLDGKTAQAMQLADEAARQLRDFYTDLIERRRKEPAEDLLSALISSIDASEHHLSDAELVSNMIVPFNASF